MGPSVTALLLAANVGLFGVEELLGITLKPLALWPDAVLREGWIWQTLTYAFLHGSLTHLIFNMLVLWFFGWELEAVYGAARFARLYLGSAVLGGVAYVAVDAAVGTGTPVVGASGAMMGLLTLAALLAPRRVVLLFGVVPVQLRFLVPLYLLADVVGLGRQLSGAADAVVAHAAHLGGALGGALFWFRVSGAPRRAARAVSAHAAARPVHTCDTCRKTERDGRDLDFRVCMRCAREFCAAHLAGHACAPS